VSDATRCKAESVCRDALQVLTGPGLKVGKGAAAMMRKYSAQLSAVQTSAVLVGVILMNKPCGVC
jgi:hypothetical protein